VQGFDQVSAQKSGECAGCAAAGALEFEEFMDRAARVEGVLRRRKAEKYGEDGEEYCRGRSRTQGGCDAAVGGGCHWMEPR